MEYENQNDNQCNNFAYPSGEECGDYDNCYAQQWFMPFPPFPQFQGWFPPQCGFYDVNWEQNWHFQQQNQGFDGAECNPANQEFGGVERPPPSQPMMNMNNFVSDIPIDELDPTNTNKDLHDDKCWYRYATMGCGTYETVQNAIDNGYDINKRICYMWNEKLIVRPAMEIAMYNWQNDYALLLAIMKANVSFNTLYVAFTAGSFASHLYIYMLGNSKITYNYFDIITFYNQNYFDSVKRIVLHNKQNNARGRMLEYMKLAECDQITNVTDKIHRINNHIADYNNRKQFFFENVEPSFINYICNRLFFAKMMKEQKKIGKDEENSEADVEDDAKVEKDKKRWA